MRKPFALTLAAFACAVSLFTLAKAQNPDPNAQNLASSSLSNAKQIAVATMMYCQDYDEMFPAGKTTAVVKPKLMPYIKNSAAFIDPTSGKEFVYNAALDKFPLAALKAPAQSVLFYSPKIHTDGMFTVAFTDGHCKRVAKIPALSVGTAPTKKPTPMKRRKH